MLRNVENTTLYTKGHDTIYITKGVFDSVPSDFRIVYYVQYINVFIGGFIYVASDVGGGGVLLPRSDMLIRRPNRPNWLIPNGRLGRDRILPSVEARCRNGVS